MILRPNSLEEACDMLAAHDQASVLAGGTDYMVEVNFRHRTPTVVVDLSRVDELREWNDDGASVEIGSCVPMSRFETGQMATISPALAQAARTVGSPQIRAAATLGGNLGTGSPAGDTLPVLYALDAVIVARSVRGTRHIDIHDFFTGPKRHVLASDEIITSIVLPLVRGHHEYAKVGVRNAMVISIASACVAYQDGSWRIALGSVGPTVLRCPMAEALLSNHPDPATIDDGIVGQVAQLVASEARPIDDHRSTALYRRHAVRVLAERLTTRSLTHVV